MGGLKNSIVVAGRREGFAAEDLQGCQARWDEYEEDSAISLGDDTLLMENDVVRTKD